MAKYIVCDAESATSCRFHALSGIRTQRPSVPAVQDHTHPRPRGHRDRQELQLVK